MHALKTTVALYHRVALVGLQFRLCAMLKKQQDLTIFSKWRAIHLMKDDFDAVNKIIFGTRVQENAHRYPLTPEESE